MGNLLHLQICHHMQSHIWGRQWKGDITEVSTNQSRIQKLPFNIILDVWRILFRCIKIALPRHWFLCRTGTAEIRNWKRLLGGKELRDAVCHKTRISSLLKTIISKKVVEICIVSNVSSYPEETNQLASNLKHFFCG